MPVAFRSLANWPCKVLIYSAGLRCGWRSRGAETRTGRRGRISGPYDNWRNRRAVYGFVRDIPTGPRDSTWQTLAEIERGLPMFAERPAALIWGMRDWCFRPDCLDRFMEVWPQAEVHRLADVGHWVVEDAPMRHWRMSSGSSWKRKKLGTKNRSPRTNASPGWRRCRLMSERETAVGLPVGAAASLACLWEVTAPKPGNVHRGADFEDASYMDFVQSAIVVGPILERSNRIRRGPRGAGRRPGNAGSGRNQYESWNGLIAGPNGCGTARHAVGKRHRRCLGPIDQSRTHATFTRRFASRPRAEWDVPPRPMCSTTHRRT